MRIVHSADREHRHQNAGHVSRDAHDVTPEYHVHRKMVGHELARFAGEIGQDRHRLRQGERLAIRSVGIDNRRKQAHRVDFKVFRLLLFAFRHVHGVQGVIEADFFQHNFRAQPI